MAHGDADSPTRPHRVTDRSARRLDPTWFERAVEAAGHAIFITDFDGRIIYVNPAFESITGHGATDAVGRTPAILNSGHHDEAYFRRFWETILAGEIWKRRS
jgi:PAS domain S-box-containing protein